MRPPLPRFLIFTALILGVACGGKTSGVDGDKGSSSSGGSSGGSGSGGGGSGGSSGAIWSSSGAGSSGAGSSSGGVTCAPLPGCDSSVECPAPGGCGGICECQDGQWACSGSGCGDDAVDASPPDAGICPEDPPNPGTGCAPDGIECGFGSNEGCGESCYCQSGTWWCAEDPCTAPVCPDSAPPSGATCTDTGAQCLYSVEPCGELACTCDSQDGWICMGTSCVDAGPPDTGVPDTGAPDTGVEEGCPFSQPPNSGVCGGLGDVCTYYTPCETNCLCTSSGWVCATEEGCSLPP